MRLTRFACCLLVGAIASVPAALAEEKPRPQQRVVKAADIQTEIITRLKQQLSVRDGLLFIHDPDPVVPSWHAVSQSTPWTVSCSGSGITVAFGGQSSEDGIAVELLSTPSLKDDECRSLVPVVARQLRTILQSER